MALEFHKWRDQFPGWFQSQFGNKLIYTGAGAADIVLSSRMNLPGKVQVSTSAHSGSRMCTPAAADARPTWVQTYDVTGCAMNCKLEGLTCAVITEKASLSRSLDSA